MADEPKADESPEGAAVLPLIPPELAARLAMTVELGVPLFINARTDVFLKGLAQGEAAVAESLRRGALYREAGADGLFVPFVVEDDHISRIAAGCDLPLNVIARPGLPVAERLEALGARRWVRIA